MDLSAPERLEIVDHLLTTTRSVRKRLDLERPVESEVIERCIDIAIQAPTGSNRQGWHFVVVTDPELRAQIAGFYRTAFAAYIDSRPERSAGVANHPSQRSQMQRVLSSAQYLADHLHEVPVHVIPCIEGKPGESVAQQASLFGSILPATWSLMLALRARGLGSAWTTLHLRYAGDVAELLDLPQQVIQAALLPVAYFKGNDFRPARRRPARERTHWNNWGGRR